MNNLPNKCAAYNEWLGVDEKTVNVMVAGSMFGWDIPAVTNYEVK